MYTGFFYGTAYPASSIQHLVSPSERMFIRAGSIQYLSPNFIAQNLVYEESSPSCFITDGYCDICPE